MRWLLPLLLAAPITAEAGAWTRAFGHYYAKAGLDLYSASTYQAADFVAPEGQSFLGWQAGVYAEAGVLESHPLMIAVQAPFASNTLYLDEPVDGFRPRATTRRLGDLRLTAQTSVLPSGGPVSAGLEVKVPMYSNDEIGARYAGFEELFPLAGEGQVDLTAWMLAGASFGGPWWGEVQAGYQHRTDWFLGWKDHGDLSFRDRLRWGGGLGLTTGRLIAILRTDGQKALGANDGVTAESASIGPVVLFDVAEGVAIEGRFAYDVWANNATQGFGLGTGVSVRR